VLPMLPVCVTHAPPVCGRPRGFLAGKPSKPSKPCIALARSPFEPTDAPGSLPAASSAGQRAAAPCRQALQMRSPSTPGLPVSPRTVATVAKPCRQASRASEALRDPCGQASSASQATVHCRRIRAIRDRGLPARIFTARARRRNDRLRGQIAGRRRSRRRRNGRRGRDVDHPVHRSRRRWGASHLSSCGDSILLKDAPCWVLFRPSQRPSNNRELIVDPVRPKCEG